MRRISIGTTCTTASYGAGGYANSVLKDCHAAIHRMTHTGSWQWKNTQIVRQLINDGLKGQGVS